MTKHGSVKDSGGYFVIDPVSRKVIVPQSHKSIGTVGDHRSEQITFKCPKIIEGHDVSQCSSKYVTWINVYGGYSNDELDLVQGVQGTDGMIYLTCTIRNALTVAKGIIQFSVHFEDKDENGDTLYRWSTASCRDCEILDSINAVFGTYEAVYVSNDTLVFDDYTLVADETLALNSIITSTPKTITKNNETYDVTKVGTVEVKIPVTLSVNKDDGIVTADAGGEIGTLDLRDGELGDRNLHTDNIKKGVKIYGVTGGYDPISNYSAEVTINPGSSAWDIAYTKAYVDQYGVTCIDMEVNGRANKEERDFEALQHTLIYISSETEIYQSPFSVTGGYILYQDKHNVLIKINEKNVKIKHGVVG